MIDLRSDTVTQPTAEMLAAMSTARLGDDSRDGDPTVGKLEALAVARTGKEAAMFVPSRTMGNLAALMAHTGRGGEVLLEESSHILKSEMGAIAQVAGLFHGTIRGEARGHGPRHPGRGDQRPHEAQQAGDGLDRDGNDS